MTALRAVIYCRLSKEDKAGRASGVESTQVQEATAREIIEAQGWRLTESPFVDSGISGAEFLKRPELQRLLKSAESGAFDVVVVRDLDRLGRDSARVSALLLRLADADVRVYSYAERDFISHEGTAGLVTAVKGYAAENTRRTNNRNIKAALRARAEKGLAAGRAPYGYRNITDNETRKKIYVIDKAQAAVVVRLAETYVKRKTFHATATALNTGGVPSPTGKTWSPALVRKILQSPIYRGTLQHGRSRTVEKKGTRLTELAPAGEVLSVARPDLAIFTPALIEKVDALLSKPRRSGYGPATPSHLASSFIRCMHCGGSIVAAGKPANISYVCNRHLQHGKAACIGLGYRSEKAVDAALLRAVMPLLVGPVAKEALALLQKKLETLWKPDARDRERECLTKALADAERKATKAAKLLVESDDDNAFLLAQLKEETRRVESLRAELVHHDVQEPDAAGGKRLMVRVREKLAELGVLAKRGGVEARPVLAAVLGEGNRFTANAVEVNGEKRWQLTAKVSGGYLLGAVSPTSETTLMLRSRRWEFPAIELAFVA